MPEQEVTPEQIEIMRAYGQALLPGQPVKHPLGGIANILSALVGHANIGQAERLRLAQRREIGERIPRSLATPPAFAPQSPTIAPQIPPAAPIAPPNPRGTLGGTQGTPRDLLTDRLDRTEARIPSTPEIQPRRVRTIPIGPNTPNTPSTPIPNDLLEPLSPESSVEPPTRPRNLMRLGGPEETTTPAPRPEGTTQTAQVTDNNRLPVGTPSRIEPDPTIPALEAQLRGAGILTQEQLKEYTDLYLKAAGPQAREVPAGTAYYNGRTGEFMYLVPKMGTIPIQTGQTSTQQQYIMGPNGPQILPHQPLPGGANTPPPAGGAATDQTVPNPNITIRPPPFPQSGRVEDLSQWGTGVQAQSEIAQRLAQSQAARVSADLDAAVAAPAALNTLNTIRTATEVAGTNAWRGPGLGEWTQRVSQYLSNFGYARGYLESLPHTELLTKLNAQLATEATNRLTARGTNFDLATFMANSPGLSQSYQGSLLLIDFLQQEQRRAMGLEALIRDLRPDQMGQWPRIRQEYYNSHPTYLNIPAIGRQGQRGYVPAMRITTQQIPPGREGAEIARRLPRGTWFIAPDNRLLPGGPE